MKLKTALKIVQKHHDWIVTHSQKTPESLGTALETLLKQFKAKPIQYDNIELVCIECNHKFKIKSNSIPYSCSEEKKSVTKGDVVVQCPECKSNKVKFK